MSHPGGHHDDAGDPEDNDDESDHEDDDDESDDEDVGDPNNTETSVALFNERP